MGGLLAGHSAAASGRTAQEAIFNVEKHEFHSVGVQQGYSSFFTWMRGLSWAMLGLAGATAPKAFPFVAMAFGRRYRPVLSFGSLRERA